MGIFLGLGLVGISAIMLFGGTLILVSSYTARREWREVVQWESTLGQIESLSFTIVKIEHEVADSEWDYTPQIAYSYTVSGETYWGGRVKPGITSFKTKVESSCREADNFRHAFPPGQKRTVYYDPQRPERAFLYNRPPASTQTPYERVLTRIGDGIVLILLIAGGIGFFCAGIYSLATSWR